MILKSPVPAVTRRHFLFWTGGALAGARFCPALAAGSVDIAPQPYFAGVNRALEALAKLGAAVLTEDVQRLAILSRQSDRAAVDAAEKILARYTLARLSIDAAGSLHIAAGDAPRSLTEQGWRMFLLRLENPAGSTGDISVSAGSGSPGQMSGTSNMAQRAYLMDTLNKAPMVEKMWLLSQVHGVTGVTRFGTQIIRLSGIPVEYQVIQLFSRDRGRRTAPVTLLTVPESGDLLLTSYATQNFEFDCLPTRDILLAVRDVDGRGCVASLTIKDTIGRVYPPQAMRLAPDMTFQPQVYRADGENVRLPDGEYVVVSRRGPEYLHDVQSVTIGGNLDRINVNLKRWIDPANWGWYSGDTHIHAGGCAHYQIPTEGVSPETMIRHVRGEGLSIGDVLTWGPSWYYQKQFFTGHGVSPTATLEHPELQVANSASLKPLATAEDAESTLRYDVEVSGFPSSHAGHLVLLRLKDQDYPGTKLIEDWPSWNLPILRWARAQGALAGYAHCGFGMIVDSTELPNYEIPPMDGNGTQEAIMDVTHGLVDFLSGCNTEPVAELNAWYHMLNCGFRMAMVGETDWPCASDERIGRGRSYVRLDHRPVGDAGYEAWIRGMQQGRLYCGDGRSHFLNFDVQGHRSGDGDVNISGSGNVTVNAMVAARLESEPTAETEAIRIGRFGWHLEKARIGTTRQVLVELVVNGLAVGSTTLVADGTPRSIQFETPIARSSWVALRIFPSVHTHPVFVQVGNKPIRASKRSAQWCRACVDKVWEIKSPFMRASERPAAAAAFAHARETYDVIMRECEIP